MNYREEYKNWCTDAYFDEDTKAELKVLEGNEAEIEDRFYKKLEFGTGGLRGVIGAGTNRMNIYTVRQATQGLANYILSQNGQDKGVAIAHDSRIMSPEFAREAALCLNANGIKTYLFESLRPTPELSFAVRELGCIAGIVITASHNPREYNGYKVYWEDGAQITPPHDKNILAEVAKVTEYSQVHTIEEDSARVAGLFQIIGTDFDVKYNEQLKKQAGTDPLTGLWNRRQMIQYITEKRRKEPVMAFTIGMCDIDFFKRINDHWGHDCGDAVLVWITQHMSRELGEHAKLCRWGGEEFIFFFPDMNGDEVCLMLNSLRMKLDNDLFDWRGEWIPVTMTFGVEENDFKSNIDTLLKNVDAKLYMGKEQGRDRVIY